ncbi:lamin tail domain-containing protein [Halovivax gelatinilyticus]|uniref:lamin tail domain-containing protein n=1 Tax=Halovivax gelatinilyticus TaxID=2961597 RepID=UPI0020CA76EB|nr:lamin tail domain-containing protein [Halovivax gelatinilyticus]
MRRRHVLKGVGGIGALYALTGRGATVRERSIEIVDATDPVQAGDQLNIEVLIENPTAEAITPTLEFFVGDDRLITKQTPVPANDSTIVEFSHRTYPVREDVDVPVRIVSDAESVERTVAVTGIDELDAGQVSPEPELVIPPETSVLFEVSSEQLGAYGGYTHWYVDDDYAGWSQGPWNAAYYDAQGTDHWRRTFAEEGTYGVAAALLGEDRNDTARWTVEVAADADAAPSIDATRPDRGPLDVRSGESVDLEATVSAPAGLDRAVWWLAHADVVLGVDELDGTEATTRLSTDRLCHGCPIVCWVVDERAAVTADDVWTPRVDYDGESRVSIDGTNAPVEAGSVLEVAATVENTTDEALAETVELVVGEEVVDATELTLDPNASESVTLGYETYPVRTDVSFPVTVRTDSDRETKPVEVVTDVGPLEIEISETNAPVRAGEVLDVTAEVVNTHDATVTDEIHLTAGDRVDTASVTLEPDETETVTLSYETYPVASDVEFPVEVAGTGARDRRTVAVHAEDVPPVRLTVTGASDPVAGGEFLEVYTEVTNTAETAITEAVSLVVGGERVDSESVGIDPDRSTQVVLGYETYPVQRAVEFPVTVESDGVSDRRAVRVEAAEDDEEPADPDTLELVDYQILGDDPDEEYVTLQNTGNESLDLSGWHIEDDGLVPAETLSAFEFPDGFTLEPNATVTVVTGSGSNTAETLYWGVGRHVWSEDGDVLTVRDEGGTARLEAAIAADPDEEPEDEEQDEEEPEDDEPEAGPVTVAIDGTNAPVEGGEHLSVLANLANGGTADASATVELVVGGDVVDTASVTVPGEATQVAELGYDTYPVETDVTFDVVVRTDDDSATTAVEVFGTGGPEEDPEEEETEESPDEEQPDEQEPETEGTDESPEADPPDDEPEEPEEPPDEETTGDKPEAGDEEETEGATDGNETD